MILGQTMFNGFQDIYSDREIVSLDVCGDDTSAILLQFGSSCGDRVVVTSDTSSVRSRSRPFFSFAPICEFLRIPC